MTGAEKGFLLLTSCLGDPNRKPLSVPQLRTLAQRVQRVKPAQDRELTEQDLTALGYGRLDALRILSLLSDDALLDRYLARARRLGIQPITRLSGQYPGKLRKKLELESPGVLWAKGDMSILDGPMIALVGSRNILPLNQHFAKEVGRQAALQGYALVSGNARGADSIAQNACLNAGGKVICVLADALSQYNRRENILYLSLEDFDAAFSSMRALSRNRIIHALGEKVFVAQCTAGRGGTWNGAVKNLKAGWSPVFCFQDGSADSDQLISLGAEPIREEMLCNLTELRPIFTSFLDR